jgi:hypothetical protein
MAEFDIILFIGLLTAHLIGDFVLQTRYDVMNKHHLPVLFKHALSIALLSWLFSGSLELWWILPWIGITHALTDYVKAVYGDSMGEPFIMFLLDQVVHVAVITFTAFLAPMVSVYESLWMLLYGSLFIQAMYITAGIVLAVRVGGIVIGVWIAPMMNMIPEESREPLERSGSIIGQLERLLIFFFVFTGLYSGVGFLLAAKALFRMGTMMDAGRRYEAEYVIIGTLISFTWALIFAWFAQYLIAIQL